MTTQGLAYLNYVEGNRHNVATEEQARNELGETKRHNIVYEGETARHNMATEQESHRHNIYDERTQRMNAKTNQGNLKVRRKELKETTRHNKRTEKISDRDRQETVRHNKASESIQARYNTGQLRLGDQRIAADLYRTQVGAKTAAADRAARKDIAAKDRQNKTKVTKIQERSRQIQNLTTNTQREHESIRNKQLGETKIRNERYMKGKALEQSDVESKRRWTTDFMKGLGSIIPF